MNYELICRKENKQSIKQSFRVWLSFEYIVLSVWRTIRFQKWRLGLYLSWKKVVQTQLAKYIYYLPMRKLIFCTIFLRLSENNQENYKSLRVQESPRCWIQKRGAEIQTNHIPEYLVCWRNQNNNRISTMSPFSWDCVMYTWKCIVTFTVQEICRLKNFSFSKLVIWD